MRISYGGHDDHDDGRHGDGRDGRVCIRAHGEGIDLKTEEEILIQKSI